MKKILALVAFAVAMSSAHAISVAAHAAAAAHPVAVARPAPVVAKPVAPAPHVTTTEPAPARPVIVPATGGVRSSCTDEQRKASKC